MAGLTKIERKALKLFKDEVLKKLGDEIQSLQLFGSKARGDADKHSDVDVLVVMKDRSFDKRMQVSGAVSKAISETGVVISAKKFTPEQIQKMKEHNDVFWQTIAPDLIPL